MITGWECPSCGTQRAIYHFVHLNWGTAFAYNPFLIISMPYLLALVVTTWFDPKNKLSKLKEISNHPVTVRIYLVLLIVWWVGRNII